jgi:hypothetical protein
MNTSKKFMNFRIEQGQCGKWEEKDVIYTKASSLADYKITGKSAQVKSFVWGRL